MDAKWSILPYFSEKHKITVQRKLLIFLNLRHLFAFEWGVTAESFNLNYSLTDISFKELCFLLVYQYLILYNSQK